MPSQWLSIILRYMERTSDDYKSFVCFLNIKTGNDLLSEEQLHYVLSGISEVTTDIEQQRYFLKTIVENDFKNGAKDLSNEQISKISKKTAERILQKEIHDNREIIANLEGSIISQVEQNESLRNELNQIKENLTATKEEKDAISISNQSEITRLEEIIQKQEQDVINAKDSSRIKDNEIRSLREKLFNRNKTLKLCIWGALILALVVHIIWYFFVDKDSTTYMGHFVKWICSLDEARSNCFVPVFGIILTSILVPMIMHFYKICKKKYSPEHE